MTDYCQWCHKPIKEDEPKETTKDGRTYHPHCKKQYDEGARNFNP